MRSFGQVRERVGPADRGHGGRLPGVVLPVVVRVDEDRPVGQAGFAGSGLLTVAVLIIIDLAGDGVVGRGVALHTEVVVRERVSAADSHQVDTVGRCRHCPALLGYQPHRL